MPQLYEVAYGCCESVPSCTSGHWSSAGFADRSAVRAVPVGERWSSQTSWRSGQTCAWVFTALTVSVQSNGSFDI